MIVTMRAVLVALVVVGHVFPESFAALLAHERHLCGLAQPVVLRFFVAFRTVEPLLAAGRTNGNLRVQNVFAVRTCRKPSTCRKKTQVAGTHVKRFRDGCAFSRSRTTGILAY